jgi:uncharacterized protein (DUF4415 family)
MQPQEAGSALGQASDEVKDEAIQPNAEQIATLMKAGLTMEQIAALPKVRGLTDEQILLALNIGAIPDGRELTQEEFDALSDEEIDFSDSPEWTDEDWARAVMVSPKPSKESVTIRLDPDVLEYFRRPGAGYQTRINAVLRLWMKAHPNPPQVPNPNAQ